MLIINYSLHYSIIYTHTQSEVWTRRLMGLGQTDKKLIMNIDVKRMRRGHARDTFFIPLTTPSSILSAETGL